MYKVILVLVHITLGPATVGSPSDQTFATKAECIAGISGEVERAQIIIDTDMRLEKETMKVVGGRCFSLDEINQMSGGKSAENFLFKLPVAQNNFA
jgi:hypothetical protein